MSVLLCWCRVSFAPDVRSISSSWRPVSMARDFCRATTHLVQLLARCVQLCLDVVGHLRRAGGFTSKSGMCLGAGCGDRRSARLLKRQPSRPDPRGDKSTGRGSTKMFSSIAATSNSHHDCKADDALKPWLAQESQGARDPPRSRSRPLPPRGSATMSTSRNSRRPLRRWYVLSPATTRPESLTTSRSPSLLHTKTSPTSLFPNPQRQA